MGALAMWALVGSQSFAEIAESYAPIVFHDRAESYRVGDPAFYPADEVFDLFFDGNFDLRDNARNAFKLSSEQFEEIKRVTPIYYSAIETHSHLYLVYMIYHAIDLNAARHSHDTESIIVILKKAPEDRFEWVAQITNAHGLPMIYLNDSNQEAAWRARVSLGFKARFLPHVDRYSRAHHSQGRPVLVENEKGGVSFVAFQAALTHAIYKWNPSAWSKKSTSGVAYVADSCQSCSRFVRQHTTDEVRPYQLVSLDQVIQHYHSNPLVFMSSDDSKVYSRGDYVSVGWPTYLRMSESESTPKANLFYSSGLRTPYPLSDIARVHQFLDRDNRSISLDYMHNLFLRKKTAGSDRIAPLMATGSSRE